LAVISKLLRLLEKKNIKLLRICREELFSEKPEFEVCNLFDEV
jgi:hypothetical protein